MSVQPNNQANYWRKTPRITVVTPARRKPELGEITQRFFAEGEEHAANGYKNLGSYDLAVDDDTGATAARDRELEFDSFDEVPKRQRPLVGIALVVSGVAVMVAAWTVSTMGGPWQWVATRNVAAPPAAATSAAIPAPVPRTPVIVPIPVEPRAATVATRVTPRALAAVAATRAVPRADPGDDSVAPGPGGADDPDRDSDVRASHRSRPMRGYVWSPAAKAMVASETSGAVVTARGAEPDAVPAAAGTARPAAAATTAPVSTTAASTPASAPAPVPGAMPAAPRIAPADTGPPPFESARVPVPAQSAPIIE